MRLLAAIAIAIHFTAPADSGRADHHCARYQFAWFDELGVEASVPAFADSLCTRELVPGDPGVLETAWIRFLEDGLTRCVRLWSLDPNGNRSGPSNVLCADFVGAVPVDSCCDVVLPRRRCGGAREICWKPDPHTRAAWRSGAWAGWILGVADTGSARIRTSAEEIQEDRPWVCRLFGFWCEAGERRACP